MSTVLFRRPPRLPGPSLPRGEVLLEAPPELSSHVSHSYGRLLQLLPMLSGVGAMAFLYAGRDGTTTWIAGGLFGVSLLSMLLTHLGGPESTAYVDAERRDYFRYLARIRRQVRRAAEQQRAALRWRHPDPETLWSIAGSRRMWERRPTDDDFGELRIAVGPQQLAVRLVPPETKPIEDLELVSAAGLRRFIRAHSTVPPLPIALALRAFGRVVLRGDRAPTLDVARALLAQLVTFHSPDDVRVAVVTAPELRHHWEWVKWLPHAQYEDLPDGAGALRLVFGSLADLEGVLADELGHRPRFDASAKPFVGGPHLVVVLDQGETPATHGLLTGPGLLGTTVLDLSGVIPRAAARWLLALRVGEDRIEVDQGGSTTALGRPDRMPALVAEALARQLSPYRLSRSGSARLPGLPQLLGIGDAAEVDPDRTWRNRPNRDRLRVPLGTGPDGSEVWLDLKESAREGMGPHGLVIGAPGSGKSELLRIILTGLAITHDPAELNFFLIAPRRGSTFLPLKTLPHISALVTNLDDEVGLVNRLRDTIAGELLRRQELLRSAGNYASHHEYERARIAGRPLSPLPSLLVVCDEFGELLVTSPDFIDVLVQIGRLGRSLGVHLLLASPRLQEGRLRGLDVHLSYRIALRTFSGIESRIVLGVPDAVDLPNTPGHGYLKVDTSTLLRFRAPHVSGPYQPAPVVAHRRIVPYTSLPAPAPAPAPAPSDAAGSAVPAADGQRSTLAVIIERLSGHGSAARQVWLPPLDRPPTLDQLLPTLVTDARRGLHPADWPGVGRLMTPVGLVDRPFEQRQDPLVVDLNGAAGNVGIVGRPGSGKSTLLRSLLASLALTHTPVELQFLCLDVGDGTLGALAGLPHVCEVPVRRDADPVRRFVDEATRRIEERASKLAGRRFESMTAHDGTRAAGEVEGHPYGHLFLVVDGWAAVRGEHEDLAYELSRIAYRGLSLGVHLLVTADRWDQLPSSLNAVLGTRLELRLGDPHESQIDRRVARDVPSGRPGRGLTGDKLQYLSALPRIDGEGDPNTLAGGIAELVSRVHAAWTSRSAGGDEGDHPL